VAENGADWLGVNNLEEGLQIRRLGINLPVLILGYVPLAVLKTAAENNLSLVVYDRETVKELPAGAKVHLKIETGTNRQGIRPEKAMVRVGIGLYGLLPSKETRIFAQQAKAKFQLKPVLTWKTRIVQVKIVPKTETVSYGRTWRASRQSKIAVLPVGYYDGYDRKLSNCGRVLIHGQFVSVAGRICMNMTMVDVTDIANVKLEDEVILIGRQGKNEVTAEELAEKIGTINYEVVSRINPLIPRKVV